MKTIATMLMLGALAGGQAFAGCVYPKAPTKIPDGSTSTLQQMLAGESTLKAYNANIKAYTDCLKLEYDQTLAKSDPSKMTPAQKKAYQQRKAQLNDMLIRKNDAAVDAATAVTKRFNQQVIIFKARHAKHDNKG